MSFCTCSASLAVLPSESEGSRTQWAAAVCSSSRAAAVACRSDMLCVQGAVNPASSLELRQLGGSVSLLEQSLETSLSRPMGLKVAQRPACALGFDVATRAAAVSIGVLPSPSLRSVERPRAEEPCDFLTCRGGAGELGARMARCGSPSAGTKRRHRGPRQQGAQASFETATPAGSASDWQVSLTEARALCRGRALVIAEVLQSADGTRPARGSFP